MELYRKLSWGRHQGVNQGIQKSLTGGRVTKTGEAATATACIPFWKTMTPNRAFMGAGTTSGLCLD